MISHHIYLSVALAHKESQMEATRQAHQARSLRRLTCTPRPRRSFLSQIDSRLRLYWNRVGGHRLRPGTKGRPVVLRDGSKVLIRHVRGTDAPPDRLVALQRDVLVPLELEVLACGADVSTRAGVIGHLRNQLPLPGPRRRQERRPRASGSTA